MFKNHDIRYCKNNFYIWARFFLLYLLKLHSEEYYTIHKIKLKTLANKLQGFRNQVWTQCHKKMQENIVNWPKWKLQSMSLFCF